MTRTTSAILLVVLALAAGWIGWRVPASDDPPVATTVTSLAAATTSTAPPEPPPLELPPPPFDAYRAPDLDAPAPARTRLVEIARRRRDVLETDPAWLARHGLTIPDRAEAVSRALVPADVEGMALDELFRSPGGLVGIYGGRVVRMMEGGATLTLDLGAFLHGPFDRPNSMPQSFGDAEYADLIAQKIGWAARAGTLLFFDNHHDTYAADSGRHTAFLSAFDVERRTLRWRTRPLVARARNFVVLGDVIVTGYGMTQEPDFVHVVDVGTGAVLQSLPVPSAPAWIVPSGDRVLVSCYDAEVELRVTR